MSKNFTLNQLNKNDTYDKLYPNSAIDCTMLSETTSSAYGIENGSAKDAVEALNNYLNIIGYVSIIVYDSGNTPLSGIVIQGMDGNPSTNNNGAASGTVSGDTITLVSNYIDTVRTKTVDISKHKGTGMPVNIVMDSVADGTIVRYQTSQSVKFTNRVKNIDVCCVGGGGGGSAGHGVGRTNVQGAGGGGGGIANSFGITVQSNTTYSIQIGSGGSSGVTNSVNGTRGGTTTFMSISATGGGGGVTSLTTDPGSTGGSGGSEGSGNGGNGGGSGSRSNTSEFNESAVYYSGGGGGGLYRSGGTTTIQPEACPGGYPNGADGGLITVIDPRTFTVKDATTAGIGGGGGGGASAGSISTSSSLRDANASSGGDGLVAIRIHLK